MLLIYVSQQDGDMTKMQMQCARYVRWSHRLADPQTGFCVLSRLYVHDMNKILRFFVAVIIVEKCCIVRG